MLHAIKESVTVSLAWREENWMETRSVGNEKEHFLSKQLVERKPNSCKRSTARCALGQAFSMVSLLSTSLVTNRRICSQITILYLLWKTFSMKSGQNTIITAFNESRSLTPKSCIAQFILGPKQNVLMSTILFYDCSMTL